VAWAGNQEDLAEEEASNLTAEEVLEAYQAAWKETDPEALAVLAASAACPWREEAVVLAGEVAAGRVVVIRAGGSCQEAVAEGGVDQERRELEGQAPGAHRRRAGEACQLVTTGSELPEVARQPIRDVRPWRPS